MLKKFRSDEHAVSLTTEVLIFIPLAVAFFGFLVNASLHWISMQYVQYETNQAAKYAAVAIGDNALPYIPGGGVNLKPSEYLSQRVGSFGLTPGTPQSARCALASVPGIANGIARCEVVFRVITIPTDPLTTRSFNKPILISAESLNENGSNPNVQ